MKKRHACEKITYYTCQCFMPEDCEFWQERTERKDTFFCEHDYNDGGMIVCQNQDVLKLLEEEEK
jgi:hypothetical protein